MDQVLVTIIEYPPEANHRNPKRRSEEETSSNKMRNKMIISNNGLATKKIERINEKPLTWLPIWASSTTLANNKRQSQTKLPVNQIQADPEDFRQKSLQQYSAFAAYNDAFL